MANNLVTFKFEELKVYQKTLDYIDMVYKLTKSFPDDEKFALTSQFKRAAQSIALNIAEGSTGTKSQFIRYLVISRGSLYECIVCIAIAKRTGYISDKDENIIRQNSQEISKMISGLITFLKK